MIKTTRLKPTQVPKNITFDLTDQVDGERQTFTLPQKCYDIDTHYVLFNGQVYRNDDNATYYSISADGMTLTTYFDTPPLPGASHVLQFVKTDDTEAEGNVATEAYVDNAVGAATLGKCNTLSDEAPTTSTEGVLGQLYTDTSEMHTYQLTAIDTTDPDNPVYTWTQRW